MAGKINTLEDARREVEQVFAKGQALRRTEQDAGATSADIARAREALEEQRVIAQRTWEEAHSPDARLLHNARLALKVALDQLGYYVGRMKMIESKHPGILGPTMGIDTNDLFDAMRGYEERMPDMNVWSECNGSARALRDIIRVLDSCQPEDSNVVATLSAPEAHIAQGAGMSTI